MMSPGSVNTVSSKPILFGGIFNCSTIFGNAGEMVVKPKTAMIEIEKIRYKFLSLKTLFVCELFAAINQNAN
jgi:hypothetical protein